MTPAILEITGVTKRFGNLTALEDVSFTIREGEILGLIGPNGAGKSTLVNLISGVTSYETGDIRLLGKSLRGLKPHQIARLGISRTSQVVRPFNNMTTFENVMVGALFGKKGRKRSIRAAQGKTREILATLELTAKNKTPAERLNVPERKRLEKARALAMVPKILLLDEVMAGLNPTEVDRGVALIKGVREAGVTILVIEHVIQAIAQVSDRIVVLNHGEKITEGPPDVVLSDSEVVKAYLGRRYGERRDGRNASLLGKINP
ncbi:MAG: ABC transporter ATP-binding protein [Deltaproteobacteria bacterium]|nr:ABC transporter ATP-binding protein [Deltaproteobacteria bacterium]